MYGVGSDGGVSGCLEGRSVNARAELAALTAGSQPELPNSLAIGVDHSPDAIDLNHRELSTRKSFLILLL